MINFSSIQLKLDDNYSFVGIKREQNKLVFFLPHGFDEFYQEKKSEKKFEQTKKLFFSLYKTFKRFQRKLSLQKAGDRDGVLHEDGGFEFMSNETNEKIILYSKIVMIDAVLDGYDELRMFTFLNKQAKTDKLDYSKLHKYIDKSAFLYDGSMYIDEMELPKPTLQYENTDIIRMFCFIYLELKEQLNEVTEIKSEIVILAQQFKETYLNNNDSLFSQESYEQTLFTLQNVLDKIDKYTSFKDEDYRHFYEAIERFLYGDIVFDSPENIAGYWGINAFYPVWEEMCNAFVRKSAIDLIEFMDGDKETRFTKANVFGNLKPDLVLRGDFEWWNEISSNISITLTPNNYWNDYGYFISFGFEVKQNKQVFKGTLRITYPEQDSEESILKKLIECGMLEEHLEENYLLLKKLENYFFSNPSCLLFDSNNIPKRIINILAYYLNDLSLEILLNPKYDSFENYSSPLKHLFRDIKDSKTPLQIFYKTIAPEIYQFQIIDYKYYPYHKLLEEENKKEYSEAIKIKDLRKQIVYEDMLQLFLTKRINTLFSVSPEVRQIVENGNFFKINSEFWLPYYSSVSNDFYLTPIGTQFKCDKLIKIRLINFEKVMLNYLES